MRERSAAPASTSAETVAFTASLLSQSLAIIGARRPGRRALCAAGGGITGIYFELGALKCLDDCLSGDAVRWFDMYFGISAGAVVTSLITAGYSVDELMAALAGTPTPRLPALDLRLLRLRPLDVGDFTARLRRGAGAAWRGAYLSTLQRIEKMCHRLRGDLAFHGIELATENARRVAAQLRATERPELADFFPGRRVELKLGGALRSSG